MDIHEFVERLAELCSESATLFLDEITRSPTGEKSVAETDAAIWQEYLQSDLPAQWVAEITSVYLAESAHQLRAVSILLRAEQLTGAIDPVIRALVERVGIVNWILEIDDAVTAKVRSIRAGLEIAASFQAYRHGLKALGVSRPIERVLRTGDDEIRQSLSKWFEITDRSVDTTTDVAGIPPDVKDWIVDGESYPSFRVFATFAFGGLPEATRQKSMGIYDALSAFSHPSVVAGRERREITGDRITFEHDAVLLEKLVRMALFSFGDAVKHWIAYYDIDRERVVEHLDAIADGIDAISVLGDDTDPPGA